MAIRKHQVQLPKQGIMILLSTSG